MDFHEVRFPASISVGSSGGIERRTELVRLVNGHERRNTPWSHSRRRYDAGLGVRSIDDLYEVMEFFEARRGMLHGFRWKDWLDHKSSSPSAAVSATDQMLGSGDGATTSFQLAKTYAPGEFGYSRTIRKPVEGTVVVAVDGGLLAEGQDYSVDPSAGVVELAVPPAAGSSVTAGFEFDVPVRFDSDVLEINIEAFEAGAMPSVPVVEVRL